MIAKNQLNKINDFLWEIPQGIRHDMSVPVRVYATEKMLEEILEDKTLEQIVNVTTLPGIRKYAIAMPDAHEGYGFPIGGVAAFGADDGIISPGGIGYDINCGVRMLKSEMFYDEIKPQLVKINEAFYKHIPSGVGVGGNIVLRGREFDKVLHNGAEEAVALGYGAKEDLLHIEAGGRMENADASLVSEQAKKRGRDQLGTIGAGNHFLEIDRVDKVFDDETAEKFGLSKDQIMILIHTGSRGLGHQIATDYIRIMLNHLDEYGIKLPDRELACAPFRSRQGQNYFAAMSAGANFAWANRQVITDEVRQVWKKIFGNCNLHIVYDVAHNIAKLEKYDIEGGQTLKSQHSLHSFPVEAMPLMSGVTTAQTVHQACGARLRLDKRRNIEGSVHEYGLQEANIPLINEDDASTFHQQGKDAGEILESSLQELIIHRKGATRAFPGQPVIIPGSMGTASYLLLGQEKSLDLSFGSTCHGAGRRMSRSKAKKQIRGDELKKELERRGIAVNAGSMPGLAEEAPAAYKSVDEVVEVIDRAGIAKKVARLVPVGVIKG